MNICECGCGKSVPIAEYTSKKRGWIKGQPVHFIRGHSRRWKDTLQERQFENFFNKTSDNSCWIWIGCINGNGYGNFNKSKKAHRISYELYKGPIPKGLHVLHKCDNPPCVNPEHLFLGTHKDNMQDAVNKKRFPYGEKHHMAKLTARNVLAVRKDNRRQKEIAEDYKVAISLISRIKKRRIWRHI